ncbi:Hypothetical protein PENO1_037260 [Penicillium occitanis (nom. inval.)]|nr:Hypothetical protein PENO1_037260 [Penicillium occitanis (nom. inval.)]PCH05126.1 hypothetical protein PENOC_030250 [Penicillium occitanis (nom. inval.)]
MSPRSSTKGQPNNPNASLTPWSTGRVLSPAQRERKRLMNRASQSRRRKNLKNTLKTVEARLFQIERRCLAYLPPSTSGAYTFNDCIAPTTNAGADESTTLRDLLNDLLGSIYHINPAQVCANEQFNQDAVIRGVILGWDDVLQTQNFCAYEAGFAEGDTHDAFGDFLIVRLLFRRGSDQENIIPTAPKT